MISIDISSGNKGSIIYFVVPPRYIIEPFYFKKSMIKLMIGLNYCHYPLKYVIIY